ncbi:hypothetical protein ABZ896_33985 [Streptomyces sp. NPDC047072]|uniref:hypothetical protein n=1 Tax=Streptomyces sp. NPDC047072 TaxID=3154809 RepID=UPI0034116BF1
MSRRARRNSGVGRSHRAGPLPTTSGVIGVPSAIVSGAGGSARRSSRIMAPRTWCRDIASRSSMGADQRSGTGVSSYRRAAG